MVKTRIIKQKGDWKEVLDDCRFTANKPDARNEPSDEFKKRILIAEHSPIRNISFKWEWLKLPHWVVVHWVRHKWECYVNTQRTDRTGVDRHTLGQDTEQNMRGEGNIQHLIDTMRKRLCLQASKETRECAVSLKSEITNADKFIGDVLVPNCIYRGGCPEFEDNNPNKCMFLDNFILRFPHDKDFFNIEERYEVYNKMMNGGD